MQLRVARLCLDCEELYVGSACPVCASERYAFLSKWLPSEERRRWRRPTPKVDRAATGPVHAVARVIRNWFGGAEPDPAERAIRTRASDHVPNLNFEQPAQEPEPNAAATREHAKVLPPRV